MLLTAACGHDKEPDNPGEPSATLTCKDCFVATYPDGTMQPGEYSLDIYESAKKMSLTSYGVFGGKATFNALPVSTYDDGVMTLRQVDIRSVESGLYDALDIYCGPETTVGGTPMRQVAVSLKQGDKTINMISKTVVLAGKTSTVSSMGGEPFVSEATTYSIGINPDGKSACITVSNAAFAAGMPSLGEMVFDGLKLTVTADGYTCEAETLTPSIAGVPYPRYQISDLQAKVNMADMSVLTFKCMAFTVTSNCRQYQSF